MRQPRVKRYEKRRKVEDDFKTAIGMKLTVKCCPKKIEFDFQTASFLIFQS